MINIILAILVFGYNVVCVWKVNQLITLTKEKSENSNTNINKSSLHINEKSAWNSASLTQLSVDELYDDGDDDDEKYGVFASHDQDKFKSNLINIGIQVTKLIFYSSLFMLGIGILFIYFLFTSLPDNNNLISHETQKSFHDVSNLITWSIAILVSMTKSIIIPNFVNSILNLLNHFRCNCNCCTCCSCTKDNKNGNLENKLFRYRNHYVVILRTLYIVVIPFILSLILLNDCGNGWSLYWINCNQENKHMFDINVSIESNPVKTTGLLYIVPQIFEFDNLLTHDDVCGMSVPPLFAITKCFRSFSYFWLNILFESMLIMLIMPLLIVGYKLIVAKCKSKWYNNVNLETKRFSIDAEYAMILSKLEICIIFGFICPLIVPLTIMILNFNLYFYHNIMVKKMGFKLKFEYDNSNPVEMLYIGLSIQHALSFIFLYFYQYSIQHYSKIIAIVFIPAIILVHVCVWFRRWCCNVVG